MVRICMISGQHVPENQSAVLSAQTHKRFTDIAAKAGPKLCAVHIDTAAEKVEIRTAIGRSGASKGVSCKTYAVSGIQISRKAIFIIE